MEAKGGLAVFRRRSARLFFEELRLVEWNVHPVKTVHAERTGQLLFGS